MNTACDQCEMCFFWKYHPCRTVDYRWQEAIEIADGYRRLHKRLDDSTVQQAVKFLRALRRCSTEKQHAKLCKKMPVISAAYKLHEAGGELELELQSRVLAGHTLEELAKMFGMDMAIINMYQRLFFTVADRLRARDWILLQAIGIWDKTPESLIKWLGYFGGPLVLDCFLPYLLTNSRSVHKSPYSAAEAQGMALSAELFKNIWLLQINDMHAALKIMRALPAIGCFAAQYKTLELEGLLAQVLPTVPQKLPQLPANTSAATKSAVEHGYAETLKRRVVQPPLAVPSKEAA